MIARGPLSALAAAAVLAVGMPLILLPPGPPPHNRPPPDPPAPVTGPALPDLAAVYERPLFGAASETAAEELPQDAPALVGIVGRLDQDAVAMVRTADGASRSLRTGESVDGWKLESLAIDAAFFTRGRNRVRVPLPDGE